MVVGATQERNRVCDREYLERALASFGGLGGQRKSLRRLEMGQGNLPGRG